MDKYKLDKIMQYLKDLNKRVSSIEDNLSDVKKEEIEEESPKKIVKEESFMEFFRKYNLKKETDKTLVIMKFLEYRRNIQNITTKDISKAFREVREKSPLNVADKIQMLHKKGFIEPGENVDHLKGWSITGTGLKYLEELKNEN